MTNKINIDKVESFIDSLGMDIVLTFKKRECYSYVEDGTVYINLDEEMLTEMANRSNLTKEYFTIKVLQHELLHIILGHCTDEKWKELSFDGKKVPHRVKNEGMDCEINDILDFKIEGICFPEAYNLPVKHNSLFYIASIFKNNLSKSGKGNGEDGENNGLNTGESGEPLSKEEIGKIIDRMKNDKNFFPNISEILDRSREENGAKKGSKGQGAGTIDLSDERIVKNIKEKIIFDNLEMVKAEILKHLSTCNLTTYKRVNTFTRFNKKNVYSPIIRPGYYREPIGNKTKCGRTPKILFDASGSMTDQTFSILTIIEFISNTIKNAKCRNYEDKLLGDDFIDIFDKQRVCDSYNPCGGTNLYQALTEGKIDKWDNIVVFTDGQDCTLKQIFTEFPNILIFQVDKNTIKVLKGDNLS